MRQLLLWLCFFPWLAACASATPEPEAPPPAAAPDGPFQAEYTGQEQPTLTVINDYTLAQFVFIDGAAPFLVASGGNATVDIAPGTHVLVAADTSDPSAADAVRTELTAESGYRYNYRVFVQNPAAAAPPPSAPPSSASGPSVQAEFTGQEQPTITVVNEFPIVQYVFVDGSFVGAVAINGSATFDVATGGHDVACSDSMDPNNNPVRDHLEAQRGYNYRFRVYVIGP